MRLRWQPDWSMAHRGGHHAEDVLKADRDSHPERADGLIPLRWGVCNGPDRIEGRRLKPPPVVNISLRCERLCEPAPIVHVFRDLGERAHPRLAPLVGAVVDGVQVRTAVGVRVDVAPPQVRLALGAPNPNLAAHALDGDGQVSGVGRPIGRRGDLDSVIGADPGELGLEVGRHDGRLGEFECGGTAQAKREGNLRALDDPERLSIKLKVLIVLEVPPLQLGVTQVECDEPHRVRGRPTNIRVADLVAQVTPMKRRIGHICPVDTRPMIWQYKRRCDEKSGDHLSCDVTLRNVAHAMKSVRNGAAMKQTCSRVRKYMAQTRDSLGPLASRAHIWVEAQMKMRFQIG